MKLKVCGMRDQSNIDELLTIHPEFMGLIFYEHSKRHVGELKLSFNNSSKTAIVGVFVDAAIEEIMDKVKSNNLDYVQLHGSETIEYAKRLHGFGVSIIKVFRINHELPLIEMKGFESYSTFFLFDTKGSGYGGTGKKFDWTLLNSYNLETPFFLSGGIDISDIEKIRQIDNSKLFAIDVNSGFEISPGLKNIEEIRNFKAQL